MNDIETLVTVPQAKELEPLIGPIVAAGYQPRSVTLGRLDCHLFEELRLILMVGGHGKTQLAVHTQHLIDQVADLRVVVCAGAAGRLDADLALGDVVVGTSTIEHDYKLRFARRPLPRYEANAQLLAELEIAARQPGRPFRGCLELLRAAMRTSSIQRELSTFGRQPGLCALPGRVRGQPARHASVDASSLRCEPLQTALTMRQPPISRRISSIQCRIS